MEVNTLFVEVEVEVVVGIRCIFPFVMCRTSILFL